MGRVKRFTLFLITLLMTSQFMTVFAQNIVDKALLCEQAKGKAPNVKVYMTGSNMTKNSTITGTVGEINLSQTGEIQTFEESGESIRYIILFDNSGSVNIKQFEETKLQLSKLRRGMKNSDEMLLYTVGSTDISADKVDVLGRTANAAEKDMVKDDCAKIENIEYIPGVESRTILYRSLNEVLEEQSVQSAIDKNRTVIILLTDGEDDSDEVNGRNNDKDATLANVKASSIPVYGILLNNTARKPNEEKMIFTKNQILNSANGNGYFYNCSTESEAEVVADAFDTIHNVLHKETYVVSLMAATNKIVVGKSELALTVDNKAVTPVLLDYSDYEKDSDAPIVLGIVEKQGRNTIGFTIEDENGVNIGDIEEITHYAIQSEADGKSWTIEQVSVTQDGTGVNVILTVNEADFLNGEYTLIVDGIRDLSQDENAMDEVKMNFTVEDGLDPASVERKEFVQKNWWIALIVIVVILGVIALIFIRKRAVKIVKVEAEELHKADCKLIRLTVTDRLGTTRDVEYNVEGSVFIGRSEINEIFFDDDRLSKQHFVIEVSKMGCYIEDLDSTNGTFVNGVKVTNRRLLLDGDTITAGRETFVIHMEKGQFGDYDLDESDENI